MDNNEMRSTLDGLLEKFDKLNDDCYIAARKMDDKDLDRIGRELVSLGNFIKGTAYNMGQGVRK